MPPRWLPVAILFALAAPLTLTGCDDPCQQLRHKVCDDLRDKRRCSVLERPGTLEALSRDTCERNLRRLDR